MDSSKLNELLNKYEKGTCTDSEIMLLYRFFDSYQDEVDIWGTKGSKEKERVHSQLEKRVKGKILALEVKQKPRLETFIKIAAAVVLLLSIGFVARMALSEEMTIVEYERIVSNDRGIKKVDLMDGSSVWLNRNSELKVPKTFSKAKFREVILDGEAFFDIAKNKERPFVVSSNDIKTKVFGTRFNIWEENGASVVSLVEGSVEVIGPLEKVLLKPNEKAIYKNGENNIEVIAMDKELELAWMSNNFEFEHTELSRVATLLERRFHKIIEFDNPRLSGKKVTGYYRDESLNTILLSVTQAGNLDYRFIDETHILIFEPTKK